MPEQLAVNDIQLGFGNIEANQKFIGMSTICLSEFYVIVNILGGSYSSSPVNSENSYIFKSSPSSPTPPTLSPQNFNGKVKSPFSDIKSNNSDTPSIKDLDLEENIDPSIPDATNWSFEDVYNYFAQYFPDEAKVFKEQVRLVIFFLKLVFHF